MPQPTSSTRSPRSRPTLPQHRLVGRELLLLVHRPRLGRTAHGSMTMKHSYGEHRAEPLLLRGHGPRRAGGAGPHDLLRMARRGRILDWAGESQYYVEPKRLAKLGYLEARTGARPHPPADRLHAHRPGPGGAARVRAHAGELTPLKSEPLLRLLIADLVGEEVTRESIATLREDLADLMERLDESAAGGRRAPAPREVPAARQRLPAPLRRPARGARRRGRARVDVAMGRSL